MDRFVSLPSSYMTSLELYRRFLCRGFRRKVGSERRVLYIQIPTNLSSFSRLLTAKTCHRPTEKKVHAWLFSFLTDQLYGLLVCLSGSPFLFADVTVKTIMNKYTLCFWAVICFWLVGDCSVLLYSFLRGKTTKITASRKRPITDCK